MDAFYTDVHEKAVTARRAKKRPKQRARINTKGMVETKVYQMTAEDIQRQYLQGIVDTYAVAIGQMLGYTSSVYAL